MSQVEDEEIRVTRHFGHKITQQQEINAQGKQKTKSAGIGHGVEAFVLMSFL